MLSSLTVKPLLIAVGVLALLLSISAATNVKQWKQIGAQRAECAAEILKTSADRSAATTTLAEAALRNEVTVLRQDLERANDAAKELAARNAQNTKLLSQYRKQVDADQDSSTPLTDAERERLRSLETEYRIRSQGSDQARVRQRAACVAAAPLREPVTQWLSDEGRQGQRTRGAVAMRPAPQHGQAQDRGTES